MWVWSTPSTSSLIFAARSTAFEQNEICSRRHLEINTILRGETAWERQMCMELWRPPSPVRHTYSWLETLYSPRMSLYVHSSFNDQVLDTEKKKSSICLHVSFFARFSFLFFFSPSPSSFFYFRHRKPGTKEWSEKKTNRKLIKKKQPNGVASSLESGCLLDAIYCSTPHRFRITFISSCFHVAAHTRVCWSNDV